MNPILMTVLLILLAFVLCAVCYAFVHAKRNGKAMNKAADRTIARMKSAFSMKHVDCSAFDGLKIHGIMGFDIEQFAVENFGNLCVIRANAGLMQMLTLCFTPAKVDMPLMSVDYMYILGSRTAYVEIYDLPLEENEAYAQIIREHQTVAADFTDLADTIPSPGWYDGIRPAGSYKKVDYKADAALLGMLEAYLNTYIDCCKSLNQLAAEQVSAKARVVESYSHRLISEGGISTDAFKKSLGEERTREFFDQVMFGTGRY